MVYLIIKLYWGSFTIDTIGFTTDEAAIFCFPQRYYDDPQRPRSALVKSSEGVSRKREQLNSSRDWWKTTSMQA
jgi:hypothetical protein